jgi:hypothetical protein
MHSAHISKILFYYLDNIINNRKIIKVQGRTQLVKIFCKLLIYIMKKERKLLHQINSVICKLGS